MTPLPFHPDDPCFNRANALYLAHASDLAYNRTPAAAAMERLRLKVFAFRSKAPGMPWAHPTVEHFAPLFVTLGAAAKPDDAPKTAIEGYFLGLSKRSFEAR